MATPPIDRQHQHLDLRPPPPSSTIAPASVRSLPMLLPVFILFFVLLSFLSVFLCRDLLHFASLWLHRRRRLLRSPGAAATGDQGAKAGGLDSRILASFPMIPYSAVKGMQEGKCGIECAVCLAEFSGSDAVRLLTVCCHAFHPACIDSWLDTHSTCPLCRSDLKAPPDEAAVMAVREVVDGNNGGRERSESHTITIPIPEEAADRKSQSSIEDLNHN
ncbi:RING-H2 finger protein ATL29 [Ananas comosus]|uniref:RING-type E3 ubiquitin transferase n=1 Tax=Ananas comosus TaxID=4615 RepID=A0A199V198_ANACO|nr:RING-H2 finger protein ATL29 [Ananas comosus]